MEKMIDRRNALRWLGVAGAAACPICAATLAKANTSATTEEHKTPHWSYEGEGAPENWGSLSPDFKVCDLGLQQSPIDLTGATTGDLGPIPISWSNGQFTVLNNGHTIQVNCASSGSISLGSKQFDLLQFHFHHPSEHKHNGRSFDLECHFVHKSPTHGLAVLGVFMKPGLSNNALQPIWQAMPSEAGQEVPVSGLDISSLLPVNRGYYRYMGSLTTPPCGEIVTWTVFKEPIEVSGDQVAKFASLFPMNARPVQNPNRRFLIESSL